ncbi:MAG: ROK family protein, partial [Bacilli bacterium]|nr:ROK family protein [Bacilli bacterium]
MYFLAFDTGGTLTKYGILNEKYQILEKNEYPTKARFGRMSIINNLAEIYHHYQDKYPLSGICISSPGIIDHLNGVVLDANDLMPEIIGINYNEELKRISDLNVSVENDVNCFALSQTLNTKENFLMITIGTGIGGAIIIDGKVLHGASNSAGEFGQMLIQGEKWESLASTKAIVQKAIDQGLAVKNGVELFNLFDSGNLLAIKIIDDFYNNLALGILNLGYIFNPEIIYLGGG